MSTLWRTTTLAGRLARLGFSHVANAERIVTTELAFAPDADTDLLDAFGAAANPDRALTGLARIVERLTDERRGGDRQRDELFTALRADSGFRSRLIAVLGASDALGDHLARHPADWRVLRGQDALRRPSPAELTAALLNAVGAKPYDREPVAAVRDVPGGDPATALRIAYRRRLLHLAGRDLTGAAVIDDVAAELADLAAAALEAALAVARTDLPPDAVPCRLAVIAMGKCGGRELNYVSDVDVVFVAEPAEPTGPTQPPGPEGPTGDAKSGAVRIHGDQARERSALQTATRLATGLIRVCSQSTPEGVLCQLDAGLRPEGKHGPLVRTLASHRAYYERWAKTWEFQALLKARPVAGDLDLGGAYLKNLAPLVWRAAQRDRFVEDVQAMRRRIEEHVPRNQVERQIKLGPGGLRDIEFAVQLLQLVHGRTDESLRDAATLPALAALSRGGYVGRDDAVALADAYRFLRRVEHLLQLHQLRRTHVVPQDPAELRRLGRALRTLSASPQRDSWPSPLPGQQEAGQPTGEGAAEQQDADGRPAPQKSRATQRRGGMWADEPQAAADPATEFTTQWRRHAHEVRRLHEKLLYRPLLRAVARLPGEEARLTPAAARTRLEALGYSDPAGALRHIEALTSGVSRRAAIQRTLLPVMLGWFADAADPDAGLLAFRQVSDALGSTPWYLRLLRDETEVAQRMAFLLASSRYATDLLLRAPEAVAMLGDDAELEPRPKAALDAEARAAIHRHDEAEDAVAAVRALRRRELLRIAVADLLGKIDVEVVGDALADLAAVTISAALEAATRKIELELRGPLPTRMCVVGMGRFGGHEVGFSSDADVMFVHDPLPGADEEAATRSAHAVAEELRRLLARPAPEPPLRIDPDLRPEGRQGPLVRTVASYAEYYRRWSSPWESQALLRADPVAGDAEVGERFGALVDRLRYPDGGIADGAVREIRRLKARMEAERLPRGADPAAHTKLGRGGLSDVEWVVQLLQLRHASVVPELRTTRTLPALSAAAEAGLIAADDAAVLASAWRTASRIRGAITLVRGRASDVLPTQPRELSAVSRVLGYGPGRSGELLEEYRRTTRRARAVMERLFYD